MKIELRGNGSVHLSGYVNVTEKRSRVMKRYGRNFVEKVVPGTFAEAVRAAEEEKRAINLKIDHNRVIANTLDGSLKLKEDSVGLYASAVVNDSEFEKRAENGEVKGWSFGFYPLKDEYRALYDENGRTDLEERSLEKVKLTEVTLCINANPCYEATTFELRGGENTVYERRGFEDEVEIEKNYTEEKRAESEFSELLRGKSKPDGLADSSFRFNIDETDRADMEKRLADLRN